MSVLQPETPAPHQAPVDPTSAPENEAPAGQGGSGYPSSQPRQHVRGTRTGRVWVGVFAATLIAVLLIIFMIQNTQTVQVSFLGMTGSTSLSLMLLIAAVGGILITLILGSVRILQLRHAVRKPR